MNWFATSVHGISGVFLVVAGLLFFLYAREFYIRGVPTEWGVISLGLVGFGIGTGIVPFIGSLVSAGLQTASGFIVVLGFGLAYWRSTGGFS